MTSYLSSSVIFTPPSVNTHALNTNHCWLAVGMTSIRVWKTLSGIGQTGDVIEVNLLLACRSKSILYITLQMNQLCIETNPNQAPLDKP